MTRVFCLTLWGGAAPLAEALSLVETWMGGAKEPHPQLNPKDMLYLGFMGASFFFFFLTSVHQSVDKRLRHELHFTCAYMEDSLGPNRSTLTPEYLDLECCGGYCIINIDPKAEKLHPVRSSSFSSKLFFSVCLKLLVDLCCCWCCFWATWGQCDKLQMRHLTYKECCHLFGGVFVSTWCMESNIHSPFIAVLVSTNSWDLV